MNGLVAPEVGCVVSNLANAVEMDRLGVAAENGPTEIVAIDKGSTTFGRIAGTDEHVSR